MTALESTVSLLRQLSEDELYAIQGVAKAFIANANNHVFSPQTEDEFMMRIDASIANGKDGYYQDAAVVEEELRTEFGL